MTIEITDEMVDMACGRFSNHPGGQWPSMRAALQAVVPLIEQAVRAEAQEHWEGLSHEQDGDKARIRELEAELADCKNEAFESYKSALRSEAELAQGCQRCASMTAMVNAANGRAEVAESVAHNTRAELGLRDEELRLCHAELAQARAGGGEWTIEDAERVARALSLSHPGVSIGISETLDALRECFPHRLPATQEPAREPVQPADVPAGWQCASPVDVLRPNDRHGLVEAQPADVLTREERAHVDELRSDLDLMSDDVGQETLAIIDRLASDLAQERGRVRRTEARVKETMQAAGEAENELTQLRERVREVVASMASKMTAGSEQMEVWIDKLEAAIGATKVGGL